MSNAENSSSELRHNIRVTFNVSSDQDPNFHHETSFYTANLSGASLIEMEKDLLALAAKWVEASA